MRLFVAVDPSIEVRARIERAMTRLRAQAPKAKWVNADGLHLTLAFLGEVEQGRANALAAALGAVTAQRAPFALHLAGGGCFGAPHKPRVLWVGATGDTAPIVALAKAVSEALIPFGITPEDRPYAPHLTLARARDGRGDAGLGTCVEGLALEDFGAFEVSSVALYRSELGPGGARYTALARPALGAAG